MDTIQELAGAQKVRFLILSPIRHLPSSVPLKVDSHNALLDLYTQALHELAAKRDAAFVSLFDSRVFTPIVESSANSENGIHLNLIGYRAAAGAIEESLGWGSGEWFTSPQAETLRQVIIQKNELFFHHSRPGKLASTRGFAPGEKGHSPARDPRFQSAPGGGKKEGRVVAVAKAGGAAAAAAAADRVGRRQVHAAAAPDVHGRRRSGSQPL